MTSGEGCCSSAAPAENVNVVLYLSDAASCPAKQICSLFCFKLHSVVCVKSVFFFFTSILLLCFMLL